MADKVDKAVVTKAEALQALVDNHEKRLKSALRSMEKQVIDLVKELKTKDGLLLSHDANLSFAMKSREELLRIFETEYVDGFAHKAVKDFDKAAGFIRDYHKAIDIPISFTTKDVDVIDALKRGAFAQLDVLGKDFQETIADEVYKATLSGRRFSDMVDSVRNSLTGIEDMRGVPMTNHAKTIAQDALMEFDAAISKKKAEDAGVDTYLYYGALVKDSRDFCQENVGQVLTKDEWYKLADEWGTWSGKKEGDFFLVRGGYNCIHQLIPAPRGK